MNEEKEKYSQRKCYEHNTIKVSAPEASQKVVATVNTFLNKEFIKVSATQAELKKVEYVVSTFLKQDISNSPIIKYNDLAKLWRDRQVDYTLGGRNLIIAFCHNFLQHLPIYPYY
ncbi:hypothetical protein [Emticicia fontis]